MEQNLPKYIEIKDRTPIHQNIEESIRSTKYGRNEEYGYYNKCNLFMCDVASKFGVEIPKNRDDMTYQENHSLGIHKDLPARAPFLHRYFLKRSELPNSGVYRVGHDKISKLASMGGLVFVLGRGHATVAAPSDDPWPLIYRSDLSNRGADKRTRVGIKNPEKLDYFFINPPQYNFFNKMLKTSGYSDYDIANKFIITDKGRMTSRSYDVDLDKTREFRFDINPKHLSLFGK